MSVQDWVFKQFAERYHSSLFRQNNLQDYPQNMRLKYFIPGPDYMNLSQAGDDSTKYLESVIQDFSFTLQNYR